MKTREILENFVTNAHSEADSSFWSLIERILKERIKPVFAKTKNPAITAEGRKNFHPVPLPRFDASIIDPATKLWKISAVYATTVLAWVIAQYQVRSSTPALGRIADCYDTGKGSTLSRSPLSTTRPTNSCPDRRR